MFKEVKKTYILWTCLLIGYTASAQSNFQIKIDSVMKLAHKRGIFNGNILIANKGKIIYQGSFGYAAANKKGKLTSDLRFDIGSVSKEFNGTGIMILKERSLLNLDDPISKYLPELPKWSKKVKIRHLLNYTSGIPIFDPLSQERDSDILQNLMGLKELKFVPGTAYIYNHYNVYLQMRIIEKISGMTYAEFIKKNIFIPCGMTVALVDCQPNSQGMAQAFNNEFKESPYMQGMTGWVRLTILDLYRWTECLNDYKIISRESFRELAFNFPGGESSLGTTGFENGELLWHQHQGSNSNYEALFYSRPKDSITIIMMTNSQQLKVHGIKSAILNVLSGASVIVPKKSVYLEIREKMLVNIDKGLAYYNQLKATGQDKFDFSTEIADLINTGKFLERRHKLDDAIRLFFIAVKLKGRASDISYAYELSAECYLKKNDKTGAIRFYQKALETDPNNKNAEGILLTLNSQ